MRDRVLVLLVVLAFMTGVSPAAAPPPKPARPDVGVGRIAWFDLSTKNLAASKEFYSKLFGWTYRPVIGTDLAVQIVSGDQPIGTMRVAEGAISPFNGVVYVQVADVQEASTRAAALGGKVVEGFPFNLPDGTGAISLLGDPSGHPIGLYAHKLLPEPTAAGK
ncbi:MAG TPA: VOC family protein [Dongiaceae bacterium]|nr:VOC family protein [Dongiaceae bacterium]